MREDSSLVATLGLELVGGGVELGVDVPTVTDAVAVGGEEKAT